MVRPYQAHNPNCCEKAASCPSTACCIASHTSNTPATFQADWFSSFHFTSHFPVGKWRNTAVNRSMADRTQRENGAFKEKGKKADHFSKWKTTISELAYCRCPFLSLPLILLTAARVEWWNLLLSGGKIHTSTFCMDLFCIPTDTCESTAPQSLTLTSSHPTGCPSCVTRNIRSVCQCPWIHSGFRELCCQQQEQIPVSLLLLWGSIQGAGNGLG